MRSQPGPLAPLAAPPSDEAAALAPPLRPPGALAESFASACTSCARCAEMCPPQAITLLADSASGKYLPAIDPSRQACSLCADLPCTHACPSGALQPMKVAAEVRMGVAQIDTERCTAWRGLPCRICYDLCPIPGAIELNKRGSGYVPVAGDAPCTGCGICQQHCPAQGAISVLAGAAAKVRLRPAPRDADSTPSS
ncbi:MAG: 4Fe-4S dicluster domain-containing protein [Rhodocyclaceae bacterium]|nr:4Fe-4S dicluster domain-containing protein [Rhodocyclaceae bacterium]